MRATDTGQGMADGRSDGRPLVLVRCTLALCRLGGHVPRGFGLKRPFSGGRTDRQRALEGRVLP